MKTDSEKELLKKLHNRLESLARGNAAIGLVHSREKWSKPHGCVYGVGLGLSMAARVVKAIALEAGVNPAELLQSNFEDFPRHAETISQALSLSDVPNDCPLGLGEQEIMRILELSETRRLHNSPSCSDTKDANSQSSAVSPCRIPIQ